MKLLIDTNIVLNVLLKQGNFFESSKRILELASDDDYFEYISATSITDIHYILKTHFHSSKEAKNAIRKLMSFISIVGVSALEIENALELDWNDFEDCIQYSAAKISQLDAIITRNKNDFKESTLPIFTPEEFLERY